MNREERDEEKGVGNNSDSGGGVAPPKLSSLLKCDDPFQVKLARNSLVSAGLDARVAPSVIALVFTSLDITCVKDSTRVWVLDFAAERRPNNVSLLLIAWSMRILPEFKETGFE